MGRNDGNATTKEESSLSVVVGNQGLKATTMSPSTRIPTKSLSSSSSSSSQARLHPHHAAASTTADTPSSSSSSPSSSNNNLHKNKNSSSSNTDLDFIGTNHAVKNLFRIPYQSTDQPLCIAVHNLDGTLLIDDTVTEDDIEGQLNNFVVPTTSPKSVQTQTTTTATTDYHEQQQPLPPSSQSLSLALTTTPTSEQLSKSAPSSSQSRNEALSMLSDMIQRIRLQEETGKEQPQQQQLTTTGPGSVREYVQWKFQDMNLLVGSDALIVRSEATQQQDSSSSSSLAIRVEEAHHLKLLLQQLQQQQQQQQQHHSKDEELLTTKEREPQPQRSYAQVLLQQKRIQSQQEEERESSSSEEEDEEQNVPLNLDRVQLQTCLVPSSGPLGGLLVEGPSSTMQSSSQPNSLPLSRSGTKLSSSPICVVLDAYLDNVMAEVPQLALCLQEKGLIQSVKLLQTEEIPSMMMHPSTLDTSLPVDLASRHYRSETEDLFSPSIMEANASALLRFLKTNCTRNNATYMLRREPGDRPDNIQLYDISSISAQRQRKWMFWLATMSYRFAMRLRQLERRDVLPVHKKRAFRDRQRSLYQTTLDLLQDILDMDGNAHESLVASVREHMADTFLGETEDSMPQETSNDPPPRPRSPPTVLMSSSSLSPPSSPVILRRKITEQQRKQQQHQGEGEQWQEQPYANVSVDALNKAHDHLVCAIKILWPVLEKHLEEPALPKNRKRGRGRSIAVQADSSSGTEEPPTAMAMQLFGLNYKVINILLRLAEHHLQNYYSSSAMQALRNAARRLANSVSLMEYMGGSSMGELRQQMQLQFTWLWEHCGHFARSFASDELWRDRGHACGDDVIYVLRDVEAAFASDGDPKWVFSDKIQDPFSYKTHGMVSLQSLSAVVAPSTKPEIGTALDSVMAARKILDSERQLQREKRQVLVASCISYSRAIAAFQDITQSDIPPFPHENKPVVPAEPSTNSPAILNLLRQRLGDACNETGKVLLAALRTLLTSNSQKDKKAQQAAAETLLDSAQFWFLEGLEVFKACSDLRNLALLRCNLCQCYKLRANATFFASKASEGASHAEVCLQEAANHLQAAHEDLGHRDVDPKTWDMVSEELAATFLVLAVRRRQSLLGGGNAPVIFQALRLTPGKERSILEPMEKALKIYQQSGNFHQAAATHYQLALTNSKIWTCQRDETKTREKLSAAFQQYQMAFAYFSNSMRGNEPTFVLLCLDLASLYAAVAGEECLTKALLCCLDTHDAFSQEAIDGANNSKDWLENMLTLASSVEDRAFKLLRSLVKLESTRYKDLYREALTAKMVQNVREGNDMDGTDTKLLALHDMLVAIRNKYNE